MADVLATHMLLTNTIMMSISQRSKLKYKSGAMGFKASRERRPLQRRGLGWKEHILWWKIERTGLFSRAFFLRLKFCRCLFAVGWVSPVLRLLQRAGDVDVFRERWVDISGVHLKRSDGTADRVQTINNSLQL